MGLSGWRKMRVRMKSDDSHSHLCELCGDRVICLEPPEMECAGQRFRDCAKCYREPEEKPE